VSNSFKERIHFVKFCRGSTHRTECTRIQRPLMAIGYEFIDINYAVISISEITILRQAGRAGKRGRPETNAVATSLLGTISHWIGANCEMRYANLGPVWQREILHGGTRHGERVRRGNGLSHHNPPCLRASVVISLVVTAGSVSIGRDRRLGSISALDVPFESILEPGEMGNCAWYPLRNNSVGRLR